MVCIYDSGIGGITALRALRAAAPATDILYLGDTARVPYGTKDAGAICRYAREALGFLASHRPEAILVACGTVSTVALPTLGSEYGCPVIGIAEAGIRAALFSGATRFAVLGTEATVRSGTFATRLSLLAPGATVRSLACPLFVALAEAGLTEEDDPIPRLVTERTLSPLLALSPEVILLACTHFPWLSHHIARLFPSSHLVDCGAAATLELLPLLDGRGTGTCLACVTEGADAFRRSLLRMGADGLVDRVETVTLS